MPPSTASSSPLSSAPRVAIIGGGAIGLACGWRLAQGGAEVTIFERGIAGRGASWAAAGMLAASCEAEPGEEDLLPLARASQALWPAFARELEAAAGSRIGYRDEGTLLVATDRDALARLRAAHEYQRRLGLDPAWLDSTALRRREPQLHPRILGALASPQDHQVDNRRLVAALATAFARAGGVLAQHAEVTALIVERGRAAGIRLGAAEHRADIVILAAGAWSPRIPGIAELRLPVRPLKGQALALQMDPAAPLLRHVVWSGGVYLVPREDGRLVIGATVEERGFDASLTAGGMLSLLDGAWRVLPAIEDLPIAESWAGFRPASRDDAPILGPCAIDGLALATGHHRNGILLTPITAAAIAELVLRGALLAVARDFTLARFAALDEKGDPRHARQR